MKKEAVIKLVNGKSFQFEVQKINVTSTFLAAASFNVNVNESFYLEITHEHLNSSIDLSNLKDTLVLHFDENDIMQGATYVLPKTSGNFGIITQSKRLLFLSYPAAFKPDEVVSIVIV